jgi:DNA-binding NarL/FixJ family response regulator
MTIQVELSPEILKEIYYQRYNHPAPLVQRRMEALWLKGHGLPHGQIAELVGVTENTIREYFELYQQTE